MNAMTLINIIGDNYHKYVYRNLTNATRRIVDSTDRCISDLMFCGSLIVPELVILWSGRITYTILESSNKKESLNTILLSIPVSILLATSIVATTYSLNLARTPLEQRLSLNSKELNKKEEAEYVVRKLNELSTSEELSLEELVKRANIAIDSLFEKINGYKIKHSRKVKKTIFSRILGKVGVGGIFNPLIHEIAITDITNLIPNAIPHEIAHQVGYAKEYEAQLFSYIALIESKDPALQYLAYKTRLDMLKDLEWFDAVDTELNQRTANEIDAVKNKVKEFMNPHKYLRIKMFLYHKFHSLLLKLTEQNNANDAYIKKPLILISAYDPPKN